MKLLPCPFCGTDENLWLDVDEDFIHCSICNIYGPDRRYDYHGCATETAHDAWNRRATPSDTSGTGDR